MRRAPSYSTTYPEVTTEESSRATYAEDESDSTEIGMPILPVRVCDPDHPDNSMVVYAMLDNCSSGVFILQECADALRMQTTSRTVWMKTIVGRIKVQMNRVKRTLSVKGLHEGAGSISLPVVYSKDDLSIEPHEIVSAERNF